MTEDEKTFWRKLGKEIYWMRRAMGNGKTYDKRRILMSQTKLGDIVGLSRASIANIEAGKHHVSHYQYIKIMEALK